MERLRAFLKKNPIAGWALIIGLVAVIGYLLAGRLFGGGQAPPAAVTPAPAGVTPGAGQPGPTAQPAPAPQAPAPAVVAQPAQPAPATPVPVGPVGRADPFIPLVKAGGGSGGAVARPVPPPPPPAVSLPPPPFPTPSGPPLPPPPLPGGTPAPAPAAPAAPPSPGAGIVITGIVGDSNAVAIAIVGGKTEILSEGDVLGDLRVISIDPVRRIVTFSRAGKRFDVRMGGD